ncbi:zinc finger CCCH domain-containing protein 18 isoform X1 [Elaeis guineensis]|uniref:Zinc finger CCCH domain-containing protein 18 isoform X2 n=1 Tax=Elaeis guineensis var. tenera TaxID=51953 RepID=A0A6I9QDM2_ELAGV|nr:zinc finger CCCH domain-containing protein 18 isoform X2 [Elaeis guineensis]XP_010907634.1 zinc finger CCCH domain-containing protein 18 isoform X2 [Elaeis guineensis]XP_019703529.1 zinc finger CCCH domain-containing protein 18 isoform X2 [Elaeis guineensis]XP_029117193.1 zinc finger CCCH domain-containing protein 18 isoform X2 [Elaeis guineensis]XP_029117195.1 zinc finger CCCH domain-containing protein 18 isoform X2 [Elaeis guineensis]
MDFSELTKVIFDRIRKLEPENAIKILGCLFLTAPSEQQMIQVALGPDEEIHSIIDDAKSTLSMLCSKPILAQSIPDHAYPFGSFSTAGPRPFPSPATIIRVPAPYLEPRLASDRPPPIRNLDFAPPNPSSSSIGDDYALRSQARLSGFEEQLDPVHSMGPENLSNYYYEEDGLASRTSGRSPNFLEFPFKACHYFYKGYCKHGANCRYFHGHSIPDGRSQIYGPNLNEMESEDHGVSHGSLEKLEMELTELLKERRGMPVSIASLPLLYFEKYGRNLQAEGYLSESHRHGKSGFSLTKLLARLKNSIRLIDRPHGQHSVILQGDAPRYMEYRNENGDPGTTPASSHQIYLTFPAESTFTEEDVSNYFKQYGPVRDVRIPCQEKRMFGFVSFLYPETVKLILTKRNPHYISGARVLVKPYKEKSRIIDRNYLEKVEPAIYHPHYVEMDPVLHAMQRESGRSRLIRRQQMEEQEKLAELERRHLSELNLAIKPHSQFSYLSKMEAFEVSEGQNNFLMADHFSHMLDALNNESTSDNKSKHLSNGNGEQGSSSQIDLPESPFASPPVESSISAVI